MASMASQISGTPTMRRSDTVKIITVDAAKKSGMQHFVWSASDHSIVLHLEDSWEVDV